MPKGENRAAVYALFRRLCNEFGDASGQVIIRIIVEEVGGLQVRVPDMDDLFREDRNRRIQRLFNGTNYEELALRFGLKPRQVRNIIDGERAGRRRTR